MTSYKPPAVDSVSVKPSMPSPLSSSSLWSYLWLFPHPPKAGQPSQGRSCMQMVTAFLLGYVLVPSWSPSMGWDTSLSSQWPQGQSWSCFQNSKPDSLLKMEEEQRLEKSPLAGSKDKFSFSFSNRKLLGYVRAWAG